MTRENEELPHASGQCSTEWGNSDDLPRALRRRIESTLAADESLEAFLASAWERHRDAPAVETIVDAARVECGRRDLEVDALTLTPSASPVLSVSQFHSLHGVPSGTRE